MAVGMWRPANPTLVVHKAWRVRAMEASNPPSRHIWMRACRRLCLPNRHTNINSWVRPASSHTPTAPLHTPSAALHTPSAAQHSPTLELLSISAAPSSCSRKGAAKANAPPCQGRGRVRAARAAKTAIARMPSLRAVIMGQQQLCGHCGAVRIDRHGTAARQA